MTIEEKQIKIAEVCGWKKHFNEFPLRPAPTYISWNSRDGRSECRFGYAPDVGLNDPPHLEALPDYFSDLNACHEMEKVLDPLGKDGAYEYWLRTICHVPERESAKGRYFYRATAEQRAEAFGKTLQLW